MIRRLASVVEDSVERFLNAVVDALIAAWVEKEK